MASFQEQAKSFLIDRVTVDSNGCWIPRNKPRENGYVRGTFQGKSWYFHRLSYCAFTGVVKAGYDVCHKCDVRNCCNPNHLFQGTRSANMKDAVTKNRQAKGFSLPQTKLSEADKECIVYLAKKGCYYKDIAVLFNVTRTNIGVIAMNNNIHRRSA